MPSISCKTPLYLQTPYICISWFDKQCWIASALGLISGSKCLNHEMSKGPKGKSHRSSRLPDPVLLALMVQDSSFMLWLDLQHEIEVSDNHFKANEIIRRTVVDIAREKQASAREDVRSASFGFGWFCFSGKALARTLNHSVHNKTNIQVNMNKHRPWIVLGLC